MCIADSSEVTIIASAEYTHLSNQKWHDSKVLYRVSYQDFSLSFRKIGRYFGNKQNCTSSSSGGLRLRTTNLRPPVSIPAFPDSCGGIDSDDDDNVDDFPT